MSRAVPRLPVSALAALVAASLLTGCDRTGGEGGGASKAPAIERSGDVPREVGGIEGATPMEERVAVLGLLNKRNGIVQELEMKPGDTARVGRAIVRLRACETTVPWEAPPETGAFVQLTVQDQRDDKWYRVFSGWLFKERPDRNVIEHPIYDVFVKSCAMTYPGGEPVETPASRPAAPKASSAPQSPATNGGEGSSEAAAPAPAPVPSSAPKAAPSADDSTE